MKQWYDEKCPHCGALNKHLYLQETDGWMVCEKCNQASKVKEFEEVVRVPVYTGKQLAALFGKH